MCRITVSEKPLNRKTKHNPLIYLILLPIRIYRYSLSAVLGRTCRFLPTCSSYMEEAILTHGIWVGFWMGLGRMSRCNPWGGDGFDPVPKELNADNRWYLPWKYYTANLDRSTSD